MSTKQHKAIQARNQRIAELLPLIEELSSAGMTEYQIGKELGVANTTWYRWLKTELQGKSGMSLQLLIGHNRQKYFVTLAEKVSQEVLTEPHKQTIDLGEGKTTTAIDDKLLRIKQKEAEFVRETAGKDKYSKRVEVETKDTTMSISWGDASLDNAIVIDVDEDE